MEKDKSVRDNISMEKYICLTPNGKKRLALMIYLVIPLAQEKYKDSHG